MKFYKNIFNDKRIEKRSEEPDPFIYKYNGYYYLFSTSEKNIVVSKSFDLINWEYLKESEIRVDLNNDQLKYPFAPEVIYYDGYFYIVFSPSGNGHYIFRSESIEGPYIQVSSNFYEMIDGSFFIDSDEKTYFFRAGETGIVLNEFKNNLNSLNYKEPLFSSSNIIEEAKIGRWNEGPFMLKRYGYYYLTYTGTHFLSDAYRVEYVSGTKIDKLKYNNVILLNTSKEFYGLGHSMTFLGPNLDSYFICYHNMLDNKRYLNISRLEFNKENLRVNNPYIEDNFMFERPIYEEFVINAINFLPPLTTLKEGTIEYNFKGENSKLVFNYIDDKNYYFFKFFESKMCLVKLDSGFEEILYIKEFKEKYNFNNYHSVRLQIKDNKGIIYFDNIELNDRLTLRLTRDKIGYFDNELNNAYIAYSCYSYGNSDAEIIHIEEAFTSNYLRVKEKYMYKFFLKETGLYNIYIDTDRDGEITYFINGHKYKSNKLLKGKNTLKLMGSFNGKHGIINVRFSTITKISKIIIKKNESLKSISFNDSLINSKLENFNIYHNYQNVNEGLFFENDRNTIITKEKYKDFVVSVDIKIVNNAIEDIDFGALNVLVNNYAKVNQFENSLSFVGFSFAMNAKNIIIYMMNFNHSIVLFKKKHAYKNEFITLKIIKDKEHIIFYNNNEVIYEYYSNNELIDGFIALYQNHTSCLFKNLTVNNMEEHYE